jgi:RecA/RadA recombinase
MSIKITAQDLSPTDYTETGLFSFDVALGKKNVKRGVTQLGVPDKTITEIYGSTHVGKSTLAYYLAGALNPTGKILLCDLEGYDIDYIPVALSQSMSDGEIEIINAATDKGHPRDHEEMLTEFANRLAEKEISCGIWDSVGAMQTIAENESEVGAGMAAKRAKVVSDIVRKIIRSFVAKENHVCVFVVNHAHSIIGGGYGHDSTGGVALKHLAATRLFVSPSSSDNIKRGDETLAYCLGGKVEKLRYGGKGGRFKVVLVPGYGVRKGLTALQDCVDRELAERGSYVKIGDQNIGRITELYEADLAGDDDKFAPFYELLEAEREKLRGQAKE